MTACMVYNRAKGQPADDAVNQVPPMNQQTADSAAQPASENVAISTELANAMDVAGDSPKLDEHAKRLLSFKAVIAMILRDCTDDFKGLSLETIINECLSDLPDSQGQSGELLNGNDRVKLLQQEFVNDKGGKVYLDNCFTANKPSQKEKGISIPIHIDIEPQNDSSPGYPLPKRGFVYCGFMITSDLVRKAPAKGSAKGEGKQEGTEPVRNQLDAYNYNLVHKALSIWICTNPKAADRNTFVQYRIERKPYPTPTNTQKSSADEPRENYDVEEVIIVNLGTGKPDEKPSAVEAINMLNVLFKSALSVEDKKKTLQDNYKIAMSDEFEQEVSSMTRLAQSYVRQGWDQGWGQGLNQGLSQGSKNKAIEIAKRMIGKHKCVDDIIEFTDLDRDVLEGLAAEMGEQLQEAS